MSDSKAITSAPKHGAYSTGKKTTPQNVRRDVVIMDYGYVHPHWRVCHKNSMMAYGPDFPADPFLYPANAFGTADYAVGTKEDFLAGFVGLSDTTTSQGSEIGTPPDYAGVTCKPCCVGIISCGSAEFMLADPANLPMGACVTCVSNADTGQVEPITVTADGATAENALAYVHRPSLDMAIACGLDDEGNPCPSNATSKTVEVMVKGRQHSYGLAKPVVEAPVVEP